MEWAVHSIPPCPTTCAFCAAFSTRANSTVSEFSATQAIDIFLSNHIGNLRVGKLTTVIPALTADVEVFPELTKSVSLGFLRVESDVPDMRSAGSQGWAGVANTHFWFDPQKGLAAVLMTQTLPFVEPRFVKVYKQFELAVYANS